MLRALVFVDSGDAFLCRVLDRWTGRRASKNTKAAATESSYAVTATCKSTTAFVSFSGLRCRLKGKLKRSNDAFHAFPSPEEISLPAVVAMPSITIDHNCSAEVDKCDSISRCRL